MAPAATFLHQRPLPCTSDTFLLQQLPVLHQRPPSCTSNYQSCTCDHFPAPATTSPALVTIFLQQQQPVQNQRPPSCTSSYQSWPNSYQSYTSDHQSWLPDLHQQLPVLHQWPPIQRLPVFNQLSSPAPVITFQQQWLSTICYSNFYDSP